MINEKLLISYLKKQKREYNEQVVILQKVISQLNKFKPHWVETHYRLYDLDTGETIVLCNKVYDAITIGEKHYKKRNIDIEELQGKLE